MELILKRSYYPEGTNGGAIIASPIALPAGIAAIGGYLALGGGILSAISQVTVDEEAKLKNTSKNNG